MKEELAIVNPSLIVILAGLLVSLACFQGVRVLERRLPRPAPSPLKGGLVVFSAAFMAMILLPTLIMLTRGEDASVDPIADLVYLVPLKAGVCLTALFIIALYSGRSGIKNAGFQLKRPGPTLVFTVLAYIAFFPVYAFVCWLNHLVIGYEPQKLVEEILSNPELLSSAAVILSAAVFIPVVEEILFRGFLHSGLREFLSPALSIALSAAFFGLVHEPAAVFPIFALGALLGYLRERTGSLMAPMLVHVIHNSFMLLALPFF